MCTATSTGSRVHSPPSPSARLWSKTVLHASTFAWEGVGCRDSCLFSLPSLRRGVLRNPAKAVHLPRSSAVLREPKCHAGLCWPTPRRLEAGPGQMLRRLVSRRQPPLPHRDPPSRLRGGRAWRENRLSALQPDGLSQPAVPAPRLLLQRYPPTPCRACGLVSSGKGIS